MNNLQVTAYLATPLSVSDDWSPALDALLEYLWLDRRGLASGQPTKDDLIYADIPLRKDSIDEVEFWACSSPFYHIQSEQIDRFRKRWDYQDHHLDWGKKKAKISTSEGNSKSYDLPLRLVNTFRIDWFAVGDLAGVKELLSGCTGIGKKRSYGYGQVFRWEVREIEQDWSLWRDGKLTRPFPLALVAGTSNPLTGYNLLRWGWKSPHWLPENYELCLMPPDNVSRV